MASVRAILILSSENKILFSRRFPTIENRLKKKMESEYIALPSDKILCNSFFNKVIGEELLQEEFKCKTYKEDLEIDHQKMDDLIKKVDINLNVNNFKNYSECPIVTLDIGSNKTIWPCIYIKKYKIYGVVFPNIDFEKYKTIKQAEFSNIQNGRFSESELLFRIKKLYEEQDLSIVGSFILIENLLNYVISTKTYEENKLQTLISNMVPFGNIVETNINFMLESLTFLNQKFINSSALLNLMDKKTGLKTDQEKTQIPGWVTKIPSHSSEHLNLTIKEELKFVKYGADRTFNIILCDILCLAELSRNCAITLPLKEELRKETKESSMKEGNKELTKTNYLGNLRLHPCAKLEDQNILNDTTRIIFMPPHDEFKMGVFEIENIEQGLLPITGTFSLKESAQNEVKLYLIVKIDEAAIGKFEYFQINIPLGHLGEIANTKIMVQVGDVSLVNNKTTLHWDLQNKVFDKEICLSGTVHYKRPEKEIKETQSESQHKYKRDYVNKGDQSNRESIPAGSSSMSHPQGNKPQVPPENSNSIEKSWLINEKEIPINNINNLMSPKIENEFIDSTQIFEESRYPKKTSNVQNDITEKNINIEEMIKNKSRFSTTSDIMSNNCFCKIHFKLNNYSLSNIGIDKKSLQFYPKLSPRIEIRRQFISNDYIIWNNLSFNNNEVNIPFKPDISLLKINCDDNN
jgi:hypothetical protein